MSEPTAMHLAGLDEMNRLIDGYQATTLVYAALKLGLPERMGATACAAQRLAADMGAPPDRVFRLLRALAAIGVCEELPDASFALSAAGQQLRADSGSGLREKAILAVEHYWPAWAAFAQCVTGEQTAFAAAFGMTPCGQLLAVARSSIPADASTPVIRARAILPTGRAPGMTTRPSTSGASR